MVRIKHRWLLVQILYPASPAPPPSHHRGGQSSSSSSSLAAAARARNERVAGDEDSRPTLLGTGGPSPAARATLVALHAPTPDWVGAQQLLRLARAQIEQVFGDAGAGLAGAGLAVRYWSNATSTFILRCERAAARLVWAALTLVQSLGGGGGGNAPAPIPCVFRILRVSGTIKKCEEDLIRRSQALCGRVKGLALLANAGLGADRVVDFSDEGDIEDDEIEAKVGEDFEMDDG